MFARLFKRNDTNWCHAPILALVRGRGRSKVSPVMLEDVTVQRVGNVLYVSGW